MLERIACLLFVLHCHRGICQQNEAQLPIHADLPLEEKIASQCFLTSGNPLVTLACDKHHMIRVDAAIHGKHSTSSESCGQLEDDCYEDQLLSGFYDWSSCLGHSQCSQSVKLNWLARCGGYSTYVQVRYTCIPASQVLGICSDLTVTSSLGFITSPGYPNPPLVSTDCQCHLVGESGTKLHIHMYELALQKGKSQCSDWLMIDANENGRRKMYVECGTVPYMSREITVEAPALLHLHTDTDDTRLQPFDGHIGDTLLKGFWLRYKVTTGGNVTIKCQPTKAKKLVSRKQYLQAQVANLNNTTIQENTTSVYGNVTVAKGTTITSGTCVMLIVLLTCLLFDIYRI